MTDVSLWLLLGKLRVLSCKPQRALGITVSTFLPLGESREGSLQGQRPAGWRSGQVRKGEVPALSWGEG